MPSLATGNRGRRSDGGTVRTGDRDHCRVGTLRGGVRRVGPGAPAHLFAGLSLTACVDEMVVESAGKAPSPALREDVGGTEELPSREAADAGRSDAGPPAADAGPEDVRVEDTADASVCRLEECAARAAYPCEWARCDSATGTCLVLTSEDGTPCSDGLDDTRGDRCVAGVCRGVLGLPRAVGWATSDRPVRLGAVRPAPDGELAVDDLGSLPRWSVSSGAPSGVPPTRVGDRLVGFHDHANVDDAPRAFELDPLTGALHVLPITLGLGSWSAPAAVEGRAAVVSCRLGAECVRVDLEPPAVHPLGVCAGPYGQCRVCPT